MNKHYIDDIVDWIQSESNRTVKETTVRNAVHWFFAIMSSRRNKIVMSGNNEIPLNYFALALAGSGSGKGFIMSKLKSLVSTKKYELFIKAYVENRGGPQTEINWKYLSMFASISAESTTQGIHKVAETMQSAAPAGSLNFYNNEFFSTASPTIMKQLLDGYDGEFQKPNIKGEEDKNEYTNVGGITVNLLGFSSIKPLLHNDLSFKNFIELMDTGWFRRAWITTDRNHKVRAKDPIAYKLQESTLEYISNGALTKDRFMGDFLKIHLNESSASMLKKIHINFINKAEETTHGEYRDADKVLRLAALRAVTDGRSIIEERDMAYAIEFETVCHEDASELLLMSNKFVRAFELMMSKPVTLIDLKRQGVVPDNMSRKAFADLISDIEDYAEANNSILENKDNAYKVIRLYKSNSVVSLGFGANEYTNYITKSGPFDERLMEAMRGNSITTWTFNESKEEGHKTNRSKENAIESHVLCFDFEEQVDKETGEVWQLKIDEVKDLFEEYEYILRSSKSHMKEGKGHRFHLYIPYRYVMQISSEDYKATYLNIAKKFGIIQYIDKSTSHRASLFNEAMKPLVEEYNSGIKLDYRCCIPFTKQAEEIEHNHLTMHDVEFNNYRLKMYLEKMVNDIGKGNRDNAVNAFVHVAKTKIQAEPTEIKEALDVLRTAIVFDESFRAKDFDKFYKRI